MEPKISQRLVAWYVLSNHVIYLLYSLKCWSGINIAVGFNIAKVNAIKCISIYLCISTYLELHQTPTYCQILIHQLIEKANSCLCYQI